MMIIVWLLSGSVVLLMGYALYLRRKLRMLEAWMLANDRWMERISAHVNDVEQSVKRRGA